LLGASRTRKTRPTPARTFLPPLVQEIFPIMFGPRSRFVSGADPDLGWDNFPAYSGISPDAYRSERVE